MYGHFSNKTPCCDNTLESSLKDDSNALPQYRVWLRKTNFRICNTHFIGGPDKYYEVMG